MENKEINVRVSSIPTIYGENLVLRLLDMSAGVYSLDRLGMSREDKDKIDSIINKPYGMILSTGPTGSGKSTSLYAIIKEINRPDIHIITLEDPVEYRVERVRQVQLRQVRAPPRARRGRGAARRTRVRARRSPAPVRPSARPGS